MKSTWWNCRIWLLLLTIGIIIFINWKRHGAEFTFKTWGCLTARHHSGTLCCMSQIVIGLQHNAVTSHAFVCSCERLNTWPLICVLRKYFIYTDIYFLIFIFMTIFPHNVQALCASSHVLLSAFVSTALLYGCWCLLCLYGGVCVCAVSQCLNTICTFPFLSAWDVWTV